MKNIAFSEPSRKQFPEITQRSQQKQHVNYISTICGRAEIFFEKRHCTTTIRSAKADFLDDVALDEYFFSGFFTFLAFGWSPQWIAAWARGFAIGCPLGFIIAYAAGSPIKAFAMRLAGVSK